MRCFSNIKAPLLASRPWWFTSQTQSKSGSNQKVAALWRNITRRERFHLNDQHYMSTEKERDETETAEQADVGQHVDSMSFIWWLLLGLLLPLGGMLPILAVESVKLLSQPYMYFGPIATIAALAIFGATCPIRIASSSRMLLCIFGIALSSIMGMWATFEVRPWPAHLASVLIITFWMIGASGVTRITRIVAIASLMLVAAGLPYGLDTYVLSFVEASVSWSSSGMLEILSIPNLQSPSGIQFEKGSVVASDICSGIDSVFAYLAICIAVVLLKRRSFVVSITTLLLLPLFALAGYVTKLSAIVYVQQSFGFDVGTGIGSAILSFVVFALVCVCILMWDVSAAAFWAPLPDNVEPSKINAAFQFITQWPSRATIDAVNRKRTPVLMTALLGTTSVACLAMGGFASFVMLQTNLLWSSAGNQLALQSSRASNVPDTLFPDELGGFIRTKVDRADGSAASATSKHLATARYNRNSDYVSISVRFPFLGWTEASSSLPRVAGNEIVESELLDIPDLKMPEPAVQQVLLKDEFGTKSYGWIIGFHTDGTVVVPSERMLVEERDLLSRLRAKDRAQPLSCFQIQLLVEPSHTLTGEEIASCFKLFTDSIPSIQANTLNVLQGQALQGEVR